MKKQLFVSMVLIALFCIVSGGQASAHGCRNHSNNSHGCPTIAQQNLPYMDIWNKYSHHAKIPNIGRLISSERKLQTKGDGYTYTFSYSSGWVEHVNLSSCTYCGGQGRRTCGFCNGTGYRPMPMMPMGCTSCGGKGIESCRICQGQGIIHVITATNKKAELGYTYSFGNSSGVFSTRAQQPPANQGGYNQGGYDQGGYNSYNSKIQCIVCGGSGKCTSCGGRGWYRINYNTDAPMADCGVCRRSGKCQGCNGIGWNK